MQFRSSAAAGMLLWLWIAVSSGAAQTISFDVPAVGEGIEVFDPAFAGLQPDERLVAFSFELAADFGFAPSSDVAAILVKLHTTQEDLTIVDFCPRTSADADIAGFVEVETTDESQAAMGIQADSGAAFPWRLTSNANIGGKSGQAIRYEKKPDQQLLVSSGLLNRSTGLFIKYYRNSQRPLEGTHPIQLTLRMPRSWRTGFLRLECAAVLPDESLLKDVQYSTAGSRRFLIPIYLAGDRAARLEARAVRQAERTLQMAVDARHAAAAATGTWDELLRGSLFNKKPDLGPDWLARVTGSLDELDPSGSGSLPRELSVRLKDYYFHRNRYLTLGPATPTEPVAGQSVRWTLAPIE